MVWMQTNLGIGEEAKIKKLSDERLNSLTQTMRIETASLNLDYWDNESVRKRWTVHSFVRIREGMEDDFLETIHRQHSAVVAIEQTISKELGMRLNPDN